MEATATSDAKQLSEALATPERAQELDEALKRGHGANATQATIGSGLLVYNLGGRLAYRGDRGLEAPTTETVLGLIGTRPVCVGDDPIAHCVTALITALNP